MDKETIQKLSRIETLLENNKGDIEEIKQDVKNLKDCYPSKESFNGLVERVEKLEGKNDRTSWYIIVTILGWVLNSVLNK